MRLLLLRLLLAAQLWHAEGGYLQWSLEGLAVNYPFDSPSPPVILAGPPGEVERVVAFTSSTNASWTLSGLEVTSGTLLWSLAMPAPASGAGPQALTSAVATQQPGNKLNQAFFQLGGALHAVDCNGSLLWSRALAPASAATAAGTPVRVSGWGSASSVGGEAVVYLSEVQEPSPTAPSLLHNTTVTALAAAKGRQFWATNVTAVGTAAFGVTPIFGVAATPSLAVYASGARVGALAAGTGQLAWELIWALPGSGLAPNITDLQYVEVEAGGRLAQLLLLTSRSWQQQRYAVLRLNATWAGGSGGGSFTVGGLSTSASTGAPAAMLWQSAQPEATLDVLPALAAPAVSAELLRFYCWTNTTIWYPEPPSWQLSLVARSLLTGEQLWVAPLPAAGATMPVAPPAPCYDRLFSVSTTGLVVLGGASGGLEWGMEGAPLSPNLGGGAGAGFGYAPAAAFTDSVGYVVAMRCLGASQPGTLCAYTGYTRAPPKSGSGAGCPGVWTAVLAAALVALAAASL